MIAPWADVPYTNTDAPFVRYSKSCAVALSQIRKAQWTPDYDALVLHMVNDDPIVLRGDWASDVWLRLTGVPMKRVEVLP